VSERTSTTALGAHESTARQSTTAVQWTLGLSLAVSFVQLTVLQPTDVAQALGVNAQDVGRHWWSVITYAFVHVGFWNLALNLYTLWLFGQRVESRWGTREFVRFGTVCAIGGWMAHLLLVPAPLLLLGSSAVVLGVLLAYATLWPDEVLLAFGVWPISTRWFILGVALLNVASGVMLDGGGAYVAHVGGLVAGWLYLRAVGSVSLDRMRDRVSPVPDAPEDELPRAVPRSAPRSRVRADEDIDDAVAQSNAAPPARARRSVRRPTLTETGNGDAPTLDTILDKISSSGLESLSAAERAILDAASRRLRDS
jgi:membrane associated rhomboid family serine protease